MARIENMTAKQLRTWVRNLEDSIKADDNENNKQIYQKWLEEARREQDLRLARKENYLRWKGR